MSDYDYPDWDIDQEEDDEPQVIEWGSSEYVGIDDNGQIVLTVVSFTQYEHQDIGEADYTDESYPIEAYQPHVQAAMRFQAQDLKPGQAVHLVLLDSDDEQRCQHCGQPEEWHAIQDPNCCDHFEPFPEVQP